MLVSDDLGVGGIELGYFGSFILGLRLEKGILGVGEW